MELNPKIKNALLKINFIQRYEELSSHFSAKRTLPDNRLYYIDGEEVMEIIMALGYSPLFNKKEKFLKLKRNKLVHLHLAFTSFCEIA